jgi:acyl-CoA reductase-like NAD-dependent aldehyde dehydrogenase
VTTAKGGPTQKPPDYARMNPSELQKTIGSHTKQIDTYRAKVNNPSANHPNWSSLSRAQQGALLRQWDDAIRRNEASRASAQRTLSQRAR